MDKVFDKIVWAVGSVGVSIIAVVGVFALALALYARFVLHVPK